MNIIETVWEAREPNAFDCGSFHVLRGIKSIPSEVLTPNEEVLYKNDKYVVPTGCEVIPIPLKYQTDFNTGVNRALQNIAGIQTTDYDQIDAM